MKKNMIPAESDDGQQELRILLKTLLVEATPEADFEERFLYDFRERVVRETACRSARSLLWEHFMIFLDSVGIRRIALGASTFSLGALCVGIWAWHQAGQLSGNAAVAASSCALEESARSLRPGDAHGVVGTTVQRITPRRNAAFYTALAEGDDTITLSDDWSGMHSGGTSGFSGQIRTEGGNTPVLMY